MGVEEEPYDFGSVTTEDARLMLKKFNVPLPTPTEDSHIPVFLHKLTEHLLEENRSNQDEIGALEDRVNELEDKCK